jgi:hypothetical protein
MRSREATGERPNRLRIGRVPAATIGLASVLLEDHNMLKNGRLVAIILAAALLAGAAAPDAPKPPSKDKAQGKPIAAAGIVTDVKDKEGFVMIWTDGEDAPAKYVFGEGFDKTVFGFPPAGKAIFTVGRVHFTYSAGDDTRQVLKMEKELPLAKGTITGQVMFANDFWVAVKPKQGRTDGFAVGPPAWKEMGERLKALQVGDIVTIKFYTDIERHRIVTLDVAPRKAAPDPPAPKPPAPAPAPSRQPTATSAPATSRPAQTPEQQARSKLTRAQLLLDNGMKERAKELLESIVTSHPGTEAAKEAEAKLAGLRN